MGLKTGWHGVVDRMEDEVEARLQSVGHTESFDSVVARFQSKVFRLAFAILGDRGLAEEAVQDIFVRVWKALPGYRGESSLSTWIYAIARNTCLTAAARHRSRAALSLEEPGVRTAAERKAATPSTDHLQADLPQYLARLPAAYRQAIVLFYLEEKSYEEVATLLDLPLGTVKTYLHRARKLLAAVVLEEKRRG